MKNDLSIEDLLGLKDKTITIELDVKEKAPKKGTLEYDIWKMMDGDQQIDKYGREETEDEKFMRLFRKNFQKIINVFKNDPREQIAVNCAGCRYSNRVDLGYGKATTKRSATNGRSK